MEAQVLDALSRESGFVAEARVAASNLEQADRALIEAERELDLFVENPKLLSMLGEAKFLAGVEARQAALDQARVELTEARAQTTLIETVGEGDLVKAWPTLTTAEKRQLLHGLLNRVTLTRGAGGGKATTPIERRVEIVLRGEVILEPVITEPAAT